jgi:hypothetical protein
MGVGQGNAVPQTGNGGDFGVGGTAGQQSGGVMGSWQQIQGNSSSNTFYPWNVYTVAKRTNNIRSSRGLRQIGAPAQQNTQASFITGGEHMAAFWTKWNTDAKWRATLMTGAIAAGMANPTDSADKYLNVWETLGKYSAQSVEAGTALTPLQVLSLLAGKGGKNGLGQAQSLATDSTHTTYQIEDPATALAITQSVLTAALGRQATPDEVSRYKSAIQSYDRANPQITHTHTDGSGNSTSSTTGGVAITGEQALVQSAAGNSAEGQAYATNNVFNDAMKILAGL